MIKAIPSPENVDLSEILAESKAQGYGMIERLIREWQESVTNFSGENEVYFGYENRGRLLGVCGINEEPYLKVSKYGRLRHLYVLKDFRNKGIGKALVEKTIEFAKNHFDLITLLAPKDGSADAFYKRIGFVKSSRFERVSHVFELRS